jgi:LytTr DNA-binding domain-containing protein
MRSEASDEPEGWADRRLGRDGAAAPGTSGAQGVTSGARGSLMGGWAPSRTALLAVAGVVALNGFVNIMTILDDAHRRGVAMPIWLPVTLEGTSGVAAMIAGVAIYQALRLAPPERGPLWRTLLVHAGGTLVFSGAHVGLMTLFRMAAFRAIGQTYDFSISEWPYEYRKDLVGYVVIGGVFWLLRRMAAARPAAAAAEPATFAIRDGATILRVGVAEILAVQAAGNYVEFALADGRRPLMRASMAQIEAALGPAGFVRTHRSWLVNAACVRALTAAGSGDFRLELAGGVTAPLSRRYPEALARLKGGAAA